MDSITQSADDFATEFAERSPRSILAVQDWSRGPEPASTLGVNVDEDVFVPGIGKSIVSPLPQVGPRSEDAEKQKPSPEERRKQLLKAMQEDAQDQMQMLKAPLHNDDDDDWIGVPRELDASPASRPTLDATSFATVIRPNPPDSLSSFDVVDERKNVGQFQNETLEVQPQALPVLASALDAHSLNSDWPVAPEHHSQKEDALMSSATYTSKYERRAPVASDVSSQGQRQQQSPNSSVLSIEASPAPIQRLDPFLSIFPMSKGDVLKRKLADVSQDVQHVSVMISQAVEQRQIHPVSLQQIMDIVRDIRFRAAPMTDSDLEQLGWPSNSVQRMGEMEEAFQSWQQCETLAKAAVASSENESSLSEVVQVLSNLLVTWCRLNPLVEGDLQLDVDLKKRSQAALPLVSVILDKAVALAKESMDQMALQQFLSLVNRAIQQPGLDSLGATTLLTQTLQDLQGAREQQRERKVLEDTLQASRRKVMMVTERYGAQLAAPETLWNAITQGNIEVVEAIVYQGGLVSGQTADQQGHSVFWDAVAFQQPDMGLLLWKHFTPGTPHGINISETHQRNGNSLLHLISGWKTFTPSAIDLYTKIFDESSHELHLHRNGRGQTFLHVAAGKLNMSVLKSAAKQPHLVELFSLLDSSGWSPRRLLEYHLENFQLAMAPLPSGARSQRVSLPAWCRFPMPDSAASSFVDVSLEVCDVSGGSVQFPAHAVILGASSHEWHRQLIGLGVGKVEDGVSMAKVLRVDPQICSSALVLKYALEFIYKGDASCSFESNTQLLFQLYRLCMRYELPSPLALRAQDSLLQSLSDPLSASIVSSLLRDARQLKLPSSVRQFLSRLFISQDVVWHAAVEDERTALLFEALSELEPCIVERTAEDSLRASLASSTGMQGMMHSQSMTMSMSSFR